MGRHGKAIVAQPSTVEVQCATVDTNECCASGCLEKVRPHPRMAFGFLPHKILPVQTINVGDHIVKFVHVDDTNAAVYVYRAHQDCFRRDGDSQRQACELVPGSAKKILEAIADRNADEAAVPSPLPVIRRPRAWLSLMPCACMYRCSETMWTLFFRAACTFRNRALSAIARRQTHAGGFDRPAGGSLSCQHQARAKAEGTTRR